MWDGLKFWGTTGISSFDHPLTRERLIQAGRIVVIDDENPLLIEELRKEGFAVDHDTAGQDLHNLEGQIYDVAIIDYHGVGQRLGTMQGLDLVKHLRRVSPRTRLVAYTSRSLSASESDFFRLSHAVLPKDLGLGDSLALVETELRKAFSKEHLFEALLAKLNVTNAGEKERVEKALAKALADGKDTKLREALTKIGGQTAEKAVEIIIAKLFFS
jgi:CheY-like chemotaxis protein